MKITTLSVSVSCLTVITPFHQADIPRPWIPRPTSSACCTVLHQCGLLAGDQHGHWEAGAMGNWSVATWCFCLALTLIISIVELCKLRSRLAVSGTTSSTPTPTTPPSSASQPASSTPSPTPNSCLVSISGPAVAAAAFPVSHSCCISQMWPGRGSPMCSWRFPATFTLCQAC